MNLIAPRVFCIGTHHKTGTLWMRAVFRQLAKDIGVDTHVVFPASGDRMIPSKRRVFLFQWSSAFPQAVLDRGDVRILHLVRDPRDVLLSGMRYHLRAAPDEEGVHDPRDDLDGRTYQQHLQSLSDDPARLMFEMAERHARTLDEMLAWRPAPNTIEARYEDLVAPTGADTFRDHLRDMGLTETEVAQGLRAFWDRSLTGGLARPADRSDRLKAHVADGTAAQWRSALPRAVAETYAERHGDALVALGYETHPTAWLEELKDAA